MSKAILILILAPALLLAEEAQTKTVRLKHQSPESIQRLLNNARLRISVSNEFNALMLLGSPEEVKTAEATIAQYDTPRRQAEFVLRVIEASSLPQATNDAADLVPGELKSLLRYSRYAQRDSAIARGMEAEWLYLGLAGNLRGSLRFRIQSDPASPQLSVFLRIQGKPQVLGDAKSPYTPTLLETSAGVKDGETVVLGASKMQENTAALIVLLTAKLLP